jgi:hypothetical protein
VPRPFRNSLIERGLNQVSIEEGRIFNVNLKRWTADVKTAESQKTLLDIPWSNPYFHFTGGEGVFFMPEVGAKVMTCSPSDGTPFILCFVTPHERLDAQPEDTATDPSSGATEEEEGRSNVSFKAGRPNLQQGDIMIRTRDGNGVWFRRGGVVEIGATPVSKRIFIPVLNYIRDMCENYELSTGGGKLSWTVARSDDNPAGEAAAVLSILSRDMAQHEFGTVGVQVGHVDDSKRLRVVIAPQKVNPNDLSVTDGEVFTLDIDEAGSLTSNMSGSCTMEISGDANITITGSATCTYGSGLTEDVTGDRVSTISGNCEVEAAGSTETLSGDKVIDAPSIKLGSAGAANHLLMAEPLIAWIMGHTHNDSMGGPTGPPTTPVVDPASIMTSKVTGE